VRSINRRQFIKGSAAAASAWLAAPGLALGENKLSPNERMNIGVIGTANRAAEDIAGVQSENIVAICDIDSNYLDAAQKKFPRARAYSDFRKLLDQKDIDAVVVAIPDHTHAVATVAALRSGRHVYCEKPLTHTISEARIVAEAARKSGLATQMGNQIHAGSNYRRVVELVKSGAIGPVREVHCWVNSASTGNGHPRVAPVPRHIDYDAWLGPVDFVPYSPDYVPRGWRGWWHFGGGTLADFCCHLTDLAFWALDLTAPETVAAEGPLADPKSAPAWLVVSYEYAARGKAPPVNLIWYSGERRPPYELPKWGNGVLFVGDKGLLLTDYERHVLLPEKDFKDFVPPKPSIPDSIGHHAEWIHACKTGGSTTCNFQYGRKLTEAGLLGNVAFRVGKKIEWDAKHLRAKNCKEAEQYIQHHYRSGWKI
jgi:predicted dehydrogenase